MSRAENNSQSGGHTVLITGATGGVGRGIALACAELGWNVWIAARREPEGLAVAEEVNELGGRGHFVSCDVGRRESVQNALSVVIETSGQLNGVVHNATSGLSPVPVSLADVPIVDFRDHFDVALSGLYSLAQCGYSALRAAKGSLLVMTSEAGFEGKLKLPPYAGVKGAQRGFVRALAREWGPDGIRVNALAPLAGTPAMTRAFELEPAMADRVLGRNPLGRLGDSMTDVGRAARFLLSEDACYVTGHTLMVDGGSCPAV